MRHTKNSHFGSKSRDRVLRCKRLLEHFRNWCRSNPYFLLMLVEPPICMRLSSRKVAHNCSRPVLRGRKYGKPPTFAWFSLKENHTSPLLPDHSNCENALAIGNDIFAKGAVDAGGLHHPVIEQLDPLFGGFVLGRRVQQ